MVLDSWPNLPDEIELELIGDYGARAFLPARIIRVAPLNETQVVLAIDFVQLTRAQLDALAVVIYSDVREWYVQNREVVDDPMESFKFIATSLGRTLKNPKPAASATAIRKRIRGAAQLYWEGHFLAGVATEISSRSLRLELMDDSLPNLEPMERTNAIVGLLLSQSPDEPTPKRLLAQVQKLEPFSTATGTGTAVELSFPEKIKDRQEAKISQLLRTLN